jgi:hypothetical protein
MKFNNPHTVLWDEMDTLRREDFTLQFPSELISQVPVKTQGDNHVVTTICRTAMSTFSSEEVDLLMLLLYSSLD